MMKTISILLCLCLLMAIPAFAEEAVLYVNGEAITLSELKDKTQNTSVFNQQTNDALTEEEKQARQERVYQEALMALISEKALIQEAENRGYTQENETVRAIADQKYTAMIASVENYIRSTYTNLEGEELDAQVDSLLKTTGASREEYKRIAMQSAQLALLDEALANEAAAVDETAVAEKYEALYAEQKARFADQNAFEAAMLQGEIVVHRPTGLKLIQKAEFLFEDGAYGLIAQTAAISPDLAEEMKNDQYARLEPWVAEIRQSVLDGKMTFAEVMEACKAGSSGTVNYFNEASTRFNDDYYSRAQVFADVGEVSTPYQMTNGYALLYYAGELPACDRVPVEEVEAAIAELLQEENRSGYLAQARTEIVLAAEITYPEG